MPGRTPDVPDGLGPPDPTEPRQLHLVEADGLFVVHDPGPSARDEIERLRQLGYSYPAIARSLNAQGIATPSGRGQWHDSSVRAHHDPEAWAAYIAAYRGRRSKRGID